MRRYIFALLLMVGVLLAISATLAALPTPQAVQITNGPVIETADTTSATIAWSTNQPSSTRVWYGTDPNNLTRIAEAPFTGGTHRVQIKGLQPNTTYYFQVESGQGRGGSEAESQGVMSFKTVAQGQAAVHNQHPQVAEKGLANEENGKVKITNGPVIERVDSNSATIAWSTNVKGSSRMNYGTDPNNLTELAESPWGAGGLTHRVQIRNLKPGTTYYFDVETGQAQGTGGAEVESGRVMSFTTPAAGAPATANAQPAQPAQPAQTAAAPGEIQPPAAAGKVPLYRLASADAHDRLYTTAPDERSRVQQMGYTDEGIAGYVATTQAPGTLPLYRLAKQTRYGTEHFYTDNAGERDKAISQLGFHYEGIVGYVPTSPEPGAVLLHRLQQPGTGEYLYTTSDQEASQAERRLRYMSLGNCCYIWQQP